MHLNDRELTEMEVARSMLYRAMNSLKEYGINTLFLELETMSAKKSDLAELKMQIYANETEKRLTTKHIAFLENFIKVGGDANKLKKSKKPKGDKEKEPTLDEIDQGKA